MTELICKKCGRPANILKFRRDQFGRAVAPDCNDDIHAPHVAQWREKQQRDRARRMAARETEAFNDWRG